MLRAVARICFLHFPLSVVAGPELKCSNQLTRFSSDSSYQIYITGNGYYPYFDVRALLTETGVLHLYLITRDEDGALSTPLTGAEAFEEIFEYFGADKIRAIVGNWGWGKNLKEVNERTSAGESLEAALLKAWTAKQAARFDMTNMDVGALSGTAGSYSGIVVVFSRSEDPIAWLDIPKKERSVDFFH